MRLAIVGGGAACVALINALSRENVSDIEITVFEPNKEIGPGRAYQRDTDTALLNVSAERMCVLPDMIGDFLLWANSKATENPTSYQLLKSDQYAPRQLFGEYLTDQFHCASRSLIAAGNIVTVVPTSVTGLTETQSRYQLSTSDNPFDPFDKVVLAVGTGKPLDIYGLSPHARYVPDAYPLTETLKDVDSDSHVLILGAGLTSVDVAIHLLAKGHRGRISLASRSGLLPSVRTDVASPPLSYFSSEALLERLAADPIVTVSRLMRIFTLELRRHGLDFDQVCAEVDRSETAPKRLRRQLEDARAGGALWQPLLNSAMHSSVSILWHAMPHDERLKFLNEVHQKFISLLSPLPRPTAEQLLNAMERNQLFVYAGLRDVRAPGGPSLSYSASVGDAEIDADWLINTIRPRNATIPVQASALVDSLRFAGKAQIDPFGGLMVDPNENSLIEADGAKSSSIFAIGQITSGTHYFTSSMRVIGQQAEAVCRQIIRADNMFPIVIKTVGEHCL